MPPCVRAQSLCVRSESPTHIYQECCLSPCMSGVLLQPLCVRSEIPAHLCQECCPSPCMLGVLSQLSPCVSGVVPRPCVSGVRPQPL